MSTTNKGEGDCPPRKHNSKWKDSTRKERQQKRRAALNEKSKELGYETPTQTTYGFWGAYIIESKADDDKKFGDVVGKELLEKAIKHNKKIKEEMHEN